MADFDKMLIKDDRLVCSDKITYAVIKGAMNNTIVPYNAISGVGTSDSNSLTWNIQVPSEQIIIDRRVIVETDMTFQVTKSGVAGATAEPVFNNGQSQGVTATTGIGADCLNVLPFHQLVQTAQVTINNTSVSLNVQDVLPALIRFNDSRYINEMNAMSPIQPDKIGSYGLTTHNTQFGAGPTSVVMNDPASPFATNTNQLDEAFVPRGSFPVDFVASLASGAATVARVSTAGGATSASQFVRVVVREPLMVSPFIWACPQENSQGIYGVQNLSIVLNLGNRNRLIRSRAQTLLADGSLLTSTVVSSFQINRCRLLMNYLTPQPSDLLVPRNVVPYQEFPRYFAQQVVSVPAATFVGSSSLVPGSASASFNSIQLNQIPDKLIIFARPTNYSTNTGCTDHFLPVRSMTINFNNQSGLLSTWTKSEFYKSSRKNGNNQGWYEWSGSAQKDSGILTQQQLNGVSGGLAGQYPEACVNYPTTGSLCVLEFGTDIELPDYFAPGSLGNFNLQFDIVFENYGLSAITDYQLVVITMNSGVFVTEKGQSSVYTGILTKQDVLEASSMEPITGNAFKRMVGGGFWDSIKSIGSKVWRGVKSALPVASQIASAVAPALGQYGAPIAQGLSMANKLAGNGAAGAGMGYGRRKVDQYIQ
jgi:hypothetical protein